MKKHAVRGHTRTAAWQILRYAAATARHIIINITGNSGGTAASLEKCSAGSEHQIKIHPILREQERRGIAKMTIHLTHKDADMTAGSIWRHLVEFSIPTAIGLLFQQLYNIVDTLVVGNFVSKQAQAAVGSTGSIINTIVGFCMGLSAGASVIISQRYGAHDDNGLSKAVHTTITVTLILSLIATVIGLLIINPMLSFMKTPEDVWDEARIYLTIYFSGIIGILLYNMGSGIMRAVGDSLRPLLFLMLSRFLIQHRVVFGSMKIMCYVQVGMVLLLLLSFL